MTATESSTKIFFTKDYKKFGFITGNRTINELKIKNIIRDIDEGLNMLKYCPIVVTPDLKIIDGQHRFTVCKILKHPVFYIIADDISLYGIAKINSRTERWKPIDFVKCYIQTGEPDYKVIMQFVNDYNMPVSSAIYVLSAGTNGSISTKKLMSDFERGQFKVKYMNEALEVMNWAMCFENFAHRVTRHFIQAIGMLLKAGKCDMNELLSKYAAKPEALAAQGSYKTYLTNLEEIYNRNTQKRRVIY